MNLVKAYSGFKFPVRIVWGTNDNVISGEEMRTLTDKLPNAKMLAYNGAAHSAYQDQPEWFKRDLLCTLRHRRNNLERMPRFSSDNVVVGSRFRWTSEQKPAVCSISATCCSLNLISTGGPNSILIFFQSKSTTLPQGLTIKRAFSNTLAGSSKSCRSML